MTWFPSRAGRPDCPFDPHPPPSPCPDRARYWVVARLVTGRVMAHSSVRETGVRRLHAAWGVTICGSILPFARGCRVGVWFGFVGAALLPAVGTCVVLAFGAVPGRCCFLRVTQTLCNQPASHHCSHIRTASQRNMHSQENRCSGVHRTHATISQPILCAHDSLAPLLEAFEQTCRSWTKHWGTGSCGHSLSLVRNE